MFLQGTVAVDPSQLTHIIPKKPTKMFKKMLFVLTAGAISQKEEHETFCAISLLQQISSAFRSMGITNVVHLAKDDVDFYLDEAGVKDDLAEALDAFKLEVDQVEARAFQTLKLVLEHEDDHLKYLIAVNIERVHGKGIYPIHVEVDGLIKAFASSGAEDVDAVRQRMNKLLPSREAHDHLLAEKNSHFEFFLGELSMGMKKFVKVDDTKVTYKKSLIRPKGKLVDRQRLPVGNRAADRPIYCGYYGSGDAFLYAWLWADLAHSNHWQISDCHVLDEGGGLLMSVGEQGFDAGASDALDPDADFELPEGADINLGDSADIPDAIVADSAGSDGGSWFDGFGDSGDSGGSCSSDSSCSSCGGCGGD